MPVFAQRRLCTMMSDLSDHLNSKKINEFESRLNNVDTNTALAAEAELSVLWAMSKVAHVTPEPELPNSRQRPDIASNDLFPSKPAIIEVRALSDDSFSGKEAMDRTVNIICNYANSLKKGVGKHLFFEFNEDSFYLKNKFYRQRRVDPEFILTPEIKAQLRNWICTKDWPNPIKIQIAQGKTNVIVSWKSQTVEHFKSFCSMPAIAYDMEENPIYKALKKKKKQVKGADSSMLKCVILVDAGCNMLRRLRPFGGMHEISGDKIIHYAMSKLKIDSVIVLSPLRQANYIFGYSSEMIWNVSCFDRREKIPEGEYALVEKMAAQLPRPKLEGYQARSLHMQGGFSAEKRIHYVPTYITSTGGKMTIKLSAGLLHEYLSGCLSADQFKSLAFGSSEKNYFELNLMRGNSIRNIQFESCGIDEDDDYVVIDLDLDWRKITKKQQNIA